MMRLAIYCLLLAAISARANVAAIRQPSPLGDARFGSLRCFTNEQSIGYQVVLPSGRHEGFTVTAWMRVTAPANPGWLTTFAHWCGDPIQRSNPDLAANAFGYPAGTNLTAAGGSITIASFPFAGYAGIPTIVSNRWPKGVYTLDGWSDNAVTLSLGGTDITLGPGTFHRNAIPGPAASAVLSGAGVAALGISRTPCARYLMEIDGVTTGDQKLEADNIVTNQLRMCTWRFRIVGATQTYRSDMGGLDSFDVVSQTQTNSAPTCGRFDSTGDYRIGLQGFGNPPFNHAIWDARLFPWCLSDSELRRIHNNGVTEILRRNLEP